MSTLPDIQNDAVMAVLDGADAVAPWRGIFVHAEFGDDTAVMDYLAAAFLIGGTATSPELVSFPLDTQSNSALRAMHAAFAEAGQGFTQLDLFITDEEGRYRFEFSHERPKRLFGEREPEADAHLFACYERLLSELG